MRHDVASSLLQVYLLLDEFIMGGELQETSKKVCICCSAGTVLHGFLYDAAAFAHLVDHGRWPLLRNLEFL